MLAAIAATASVWPTFAHANVVVEQIEAFEDPKDPTPTEYAPINFNGVTPVTETSGAYSGITFHAVETTNNTYSAHADVVASRIYGAGSVGNPFVTNVYAAAADLFIPNVVNPQPTLSSNGPAPGTFDGGAKIINNSYVDNEANDAPVAKSNLDALRRLDFMIQQADVTFVAAAAVDTGMDDLNGAYLDWSRLQLFSRHSRRWHQISSPAPIPPGREPPHRRDRHRPGQFHHRQRFRRRRRPVRHRPGRQPNRCPCMMS